MWSFEEKRLVKDWIERELFRGAIMISFTECDLYLKSQGLNKKRREIGELFDEFAKIGVLNSVLYAICPNDHSVLKVVRPRNDVGRFDVNEAKALLGTSLECVKCNQKHQTKIEMFNEVFSLSPSYMNEYLKKPNLSDDIKEKVAGTLKILNTISC